MSEIDKHYQILGLNPGASEEEIKQAYKDLVKVWHPDRFSDNSRLKEKANEKLKEINLAYEILKAYIAGKSEQFTASEERKNRDKSQPPPREPPPKWEKEKSSATEAGAIWNPNAAANWSILFTPAFGSYLQMFNWRTLNEPEKASSAQSWFYASLLMMFICFLIGMFVIDREVRYNIIWWLGILYLSAWYFAASRSQARYVKAKFGTNYPKKPWGQALLIAVGCWVVAFALGFIMFGLTASERYTPNSSKPSSSPNERSTSNLSPPPSRTPSTSQKLEVTSKGKWVPVDYDPLGINQERTTESKGYDPLGINPPIASPSPPVPGPSVQGAPPPARDSIEVASQIQTLKEIVKKDPENLPAWVELGNLYFDTDQPKEAIEAYSRYLAAKPDNPDVRNDMGTMYRKLGQFDKALEEFRKVAQSDPKHVNSRYNIGLVLLHDKHDMKGAITAWEDYLKVDPNSERGQRIKAHIEKMKTITSSPSSPSQPLETGLTAIGWYNKGQSLQQSGNYKEAIDAYSRAIDLDAQFSEAYAYRGSAHYRLGDFEQSIRDCSKVIELNPTDAMAYYYRGWAFFQKRPRYLDEALRDFNKAISINPNATAAYIGRGWAFLRKHRFDEAFGDFNRAISINPNDPAGAGYNGRGEASYKKGQYEKAIEDFNNAIRINTNHPAIYYNRGYAYLELGNNRLATTDFQKSIELNNNTRDFIMRDCYIGLSIACFRQNKIEDAKANYQKAIGIEPLCKNGLDAIEKRDDFSYTPGNKQTVNEILKLF